MDHDPYLYLVIGKIALKGLFTDFPRGSTKRSKVLKYGLLVVNVAATVDLMV